MLRIGIRSMTKVNLVVQARMGSSRLPGKMMLDLYGEPLIFRILNKRPNPPNFLWYTVPLICIQPTSFGNIVLINFLRLLTTRLVFPFYH